MLSKLLLLILVIAAAVMLWRSAQRARRREAERNQPPPVRPPEKMLHCQRCGVYFPVSEGVWRDGSAYCCEAHAGNDAR